MKGDYDLSTPLWIKVGILLLVSVIGLTIGYYMAELARFVFA